MNKLNAISRSWLRFIWWLVLILTCVPLGRLVFLTTQSMTGSGRGLGPNPVEFITHSTGDWALYLLMLALACTPVRLLTGAAWVVQLRKMLGLMSFLYLSLHFLAFFWFDHYFDLHEMWLDILKRPFITAGMLAFVMMCLLALTSNRWMMKWLGKNWKRLHRLIYVIAVLAVLHYWWDKAGKNLLAQPFYFAVLAAILLGIRCLFVIKKHLIQRRNKTV